MGSLGLIVLRALSQFGKRAAGETAEFRCRRVERLGMIGMARLERGEPAAEAGEFIRRQPGNGFGDFFNFHMASIARFRAQRGVRQMVPIPASGEAFASMGLSRQWA